MILASYLIHQNLRKNDPRASHELTRNMLRQFSMVSCCFVDCPLLDWNEESLRIRTLRFCDAGRKVVELFTLADDVLQPFVSTFVPRPVGDSLCAL
jgi:hypothetical protein